MKNNISLAFYVVVVLLSGSFLALPVAASPMLEWIEQFGTSSGDFSHSVASDDLGNVYISGSTDGSLEGSNAGGQDGYISKFDSNGHLQWIKQFGTTELDVSIGTSADGFGNAYITGTTLGSLNGTTAEGFSAFISKYDSSGAILWTEQLGSVGSEISISVSTDSFGKAYITGYTLGSLEGSNFGGFDSFLSKYDPSGNILWTKQLGTSGDDQSFGVSADGLGNVYITGRTEGSFEGANAGDFDTFISKYNDSGVLLWTKQLGTSSYDSGASVSADNLGNVFISGNTKGSLEGINAGDTDTFISKFDTNGLLLWTEQLGTSGYDQIESVFADGNGGVYVSGHTEGSLEGINGGSADIFVSKYSTDGTQLWIEQFGSDSLDRSLGVSADGLGNVYISGYTIGNLEGTNAGGYDAFIAKFIDPIPEPSTLLLSSLAVLGLVLRRSR